MLCYALKSGNRVDTKEFTEIRARLGKSQNQLAKLLCASPKAVQSFEQGWRHITTRVEREMLLLLSLKLKTETQSPNCWEVKKCPTEWRAFCSAWEFQAGHLCWYLNGTYCNGGYHDDWSSKMEICRGCSVFQKLMTPMPQNGS